MITLLLMGLALAGVGEVPTLTKFLKEEASPWRLGLGVSPLGGMGNRSYATLSPLQLHYRRRFLNWEVLHFSLGQTFPQEEIQRSFHFYVRTAPKFQISSILSIGPMVGWEVVTFPGVEVELVRPDQVTVADTYRDHGLIYGVSLSQTLNLGTYELQITEVFYKQNYAADQQAFDGWQYRFTDEDIENDKDRSLINSGWVFSIEGALLF